MRKFFLKHCKLYRKLIKKLFGKYDVYEVHIPWEIYGDFNIHYLGFDENGNVKKGFNNLLEAIKNKGDLGLSVMYDKY